MAMATGWYLSYLTGLFNGTNSIDLDTDTIKVMLVTDSYTPDFDAHDFVNDVTNEVSGSGYTAGGQALSSKSVTGDTTNDRAVFDCADPTWNPATLTARGCVFYKDTGTPSTSPLIRAVSFGADITATGGPFVLQVDSNGLWRASGS